MQQQIAQLEIDLQRKLEEKASLEAQYGELERRMSAKGGVPLPVACQRRLTHEEAMSLSLADHATINKVLQSGNKGRVSCSKQCMPLVVHFYKLLTSRRLSA